MDKLKISKQRITNNWLSFFIKLSQNNNGDKMKNKLILFLTLLLIPCNVFAYSDHIIPGGQTIGIEVNNNGIIVIGFYKVNGKFNQNKLRIGDTILKVNDLNVTNIEELVKTIGKEVQNDKVNLTIKRSNKLIDIDKFI